MSKHLAHYWLFFMLHLHLPTAGAHEQWWKLWEREGGREGEDMVSRLFRQLFQIKQIKTVG